MSLLVVRGCDLLGASAAFFQSLAQFLTKHALSGSRTPRARLWQKSHLKVFESNGGERMFARLCSRQVQGLVENAAHHGFLAPPPAQNVRSFLELEPRLQPRSALLAGTHASHGVDSWQPP